MPDLTSVASTLRRGNYHYTGHIFIIPQTVVLAGTISATPAYPALRLSYTLDSGAAADVDPDMTVRIYDSGGTSKGLLRVAMGESVTSTSLPVGEFSANTVNVVSGDTFEVVREWRISDRLVSATAALKKDSRIAPGDYPSNPPPTANAGGPVVVRATNTANFYGSTSFSNDPDNGGNSLTYAWDFDDGTPSSDTVANPTGISFPAGFRWVEEVVTDAINSKTTTKRVPCWAYDPVICPGLNARITDKQWTLQGGWALTFNLPVSSEADIDALPDGAMIVYAEFENYDGTETGYGAGVTGRGNVKFVGYLRRETIDITPEGDEVSFETESPLAILDRTPALSQLGITGTTSKWKYIKSLSVRKFLWYLYYWHTSAADVFDFVFLDGSDLTYERLAVENIDSIAGQLRDIAQALQVDVTCDRLGRILFVSDPNMLTSSDRSAKTTAYNLTTDDVTRVSIPRDHAGAVKQVKAKGVTSSGTAVFAKAGGAPAPFGTGVEELARLIVASKAVLRRYAGLRFARLNGLYNGRFVPKGATVAVPDGYDVFDPALRDWLTLTLPASSNRRGVSYDSSTRWTIEGVRIGYNPDTGAKEIEYTVDHETFGADGIDDLDEAPPGTSNIGDYTLPDIAFAPPLFPILPTGALLVTGIQRLGLVLADGTLALTANFDSASPTYVLNTPTGKPTAVQQWCIDASDPTQGWVVTGSANGVYKYSAINTASPVATQQTPSVAAGTHNIDASFGTLPGDFAVIAVRASGRVKLYTTTNGSFAGISSVDIVGTTAALPSGLFLNSRTGKIYAAGPSQTAATGYFTIWESANLGVTWTEIGKIASGTDDYAGSADDMIPDIYMPYADTTGRRLYHALYDNNIAHVNNMTRLMRWTLGGGNAAWVDVSPSYGGYTYGPSGASRSAIGMASASLDRMLLAAHTYEDGVKYGVFFGTGMEGTPTWTTVVTPDVAANMKYRRAVLLDPDGVAGILFGDDATIAAYDPATNTVSDRSGNLGSLTSEDIIGIFGWNE